VIRIRPASEHDGKTPAQWFFYRTTADGTIVREAFQGYGLQLDSPLLYWAPLPELIDPPDINALPPPAADRRQNGVQLPQQPGARPRGRPRKAPA
jgi:hypothetical protein